MSVGVFGNTDTVRQGIAKARGSLGLANA